MNFSRTIPGVPSAIARTKNPVSNRFIAAMLATFAALMISVLGSSQWASADSGSTVPDSDQVPGSPVDVEARAGNQVAAVSWLPAENSVRADGFVVTASPSEIVV